MTCFCQTELTAADLDSLVPPVRAHFDGEHPELGLTENAIRNYLEAEERLTGPTERLDVIGEIDVVPIGPEALDDIAVFLDTEVFAGNPAWAACYCMFFFLGGRANAGWGDRTWRQNRDDQLERVASGRTTGALAYVDGKLAGWCNATARSEFPGFSDGEDGGVASVVCFAIAPPYRGHGLSRRLLDGAVQHFAAAGFRRIEGYPVREPRDQYGAFPGPLDLYLGSGFRITSEEPLVVARDLR